MDGITESMYHNKNYTMYLLVAVLFICVIYVILGLTPSHYARGLEYLGVQAKPFVGRARAIRSDEWIALTPLFQIAVRGHFSSIDQISPYHESLKGFWALPIADWSLVFKPQLWAFWILKPAYAYSFYFAFLWAAFVIGYTLLLRLFGVSIIIAALGALGLFFSHYIQVWWTSGAPTFAFAPWPLIVFVLPIRPIFKIPLLFWVSAVWIFGLVYPPFIISASFAFLTLLLAFRRDVISRENFTVGVISAACLGGVFFLYFGDLIATMSATIYPGNRLSSGGGLDSWKLIAIVFPFFSSSIFSPLLSNSNECEVAAVSTLLPLTIFCFAEYRTVLLYVKSNWFACSVVGVALALMLVWMVLPIPVSAGRFLLWNRVPADRMMWGSGLLFTMFAVIVASNVDLKLNFQRFVVFSTLLIAGWLVSKLGFTEIWPQVNMNAWSALKRSWFDWIGIVPFALLLILARRFPHRSYDGSWLLFAAVITGALTFGTFNPVQSAKPIFDIPDSPFLDKARRMAQENPNGWAIFPGVYGALINGAGIPAINHTLTAPQLDFFRRIFPKLPEDQFNLVFNRYAHIVPKPGIEPQSPQADVALVPMEPFLHKVEGASSRNGIGEP